MMSIYQTRKRAAAGAGNSTDSLGGTTISRMKAGAASSNARGGSASASRPPNGKGMSLDWTSVRKADPANSLLPASREWLDTLRAEVRPISLAVQFPRIVNILAAEWGNPPVCRDYLTALLIDRRG